MGDQDPIAAVHETWDPAQYDEVVVSTLPTGASRWLAGGPAAPPSSGSRTVPVTHVVAHPQRPAPHARPGAPHARSAQGVLAPLAARSRD